MSSTDEAVETAVDRVGAAAPTQQDEAVEADEQAGDEPEQQAETFPRAYVEKLRRESAGYRERAQHADELAHRLHISLVAATGRLADPTDLEFSEDHLDDADRIANAITDLLAKKPHLAARKVHGDVGQGASGAENPTVDLAGLLRSRAS